jgi:hypothetical protein
MYMIHRKFLTLLKHTFVPHSGNEYKPHFFREHVILSLLIGSIFLLLVSFTTYIVIRTTAYGSSVVSSVLIDLTNQTRTENNLSPLFYNQRLQDAATLKGDDMVSRQYFAHFAPDGTSPWHWYDKAGYRFRFAGENLAIHFRSSKEVQRAWMESPKHRANILDPRYEDIGIATIHGNTSTPPTIFVVQMFGKQEPSSETTSLQNQTPAQGAKIFEKIIFNASYYINNIYATLVIILIVALCMMIFIEIRKQHYFHILYGVLLTIVVGICIAINSQLL